MWLVEPESGGLPIRLRTTQFATECGWDHLYIFDGDSLYSPLIAAYRYINSFIMICSNTTHEFPA